MLSKSARYAGAINLAEASANDFLIIKVFCMLVIMERSPGAPLRRAVLTLLSGADFQAMSVFFMKCKYSQDVGT